MFSQLLPTSFLLSLGSLPSLSAGELRPLSTDRPDTTESPYTVDAGHFQFEMEIAAWAKDGRERELTLGELNAKVGLDKATDLQVVLPLYGHGCLHGRVHRAGAGAAVFRVAVLCAEVWDSGAAARAGLVGGIATQVV